MRTKDWSATPFGPVGSWPQSLKTATGIMLESSFAMVVAWGPDFRFLYNDRYRPILGFKHSAALGAPAKEIFPEVWDDILNPLFTRTRRGEAVALDDLLIPLHRHGYLENCYFTISYSPIRDEEGEVGGMLAVVAETTKRVEGERRLMTLRDLARRAADAKTPSDACTKAGSILGENPTDVPFALFYLLDEAGRKAKRIAVVGLAPSHLAAPETLPAAGDRSADSWPLAIEDVIARFGTIPSGPYPEAVHTALLLPLSRPGLTRPYGFLIIGISARRELDDRYRSFLELAAEHVTTAIANACAFEEERRRADALAEIDRAKTDFFSNVSHEFRTPLTLMLGPLEELLENVGGSLSTQAKTQLQMMHRNSLRLLKLVNALLDFARIEAGRLEAHYQPVDLPALTRELAGVFRAAAEKAGLHLVVDCRPVSGPAFVDADLWEKIVFNLISNALKFTFAGEIRVVVGETAHQFELTIKDTGVGIAAQELPHLFTRFHRVENSRSRTHEGTGIGLALVQELVRLHGGVVSVESSLGEGTSFKVSLPKGKAHLPADRVESGKPIHQLSSRANPFVEEALLWVPDKTPEKAGAEQVEEVRNSSSARIVVADDNADMRDYIRRLLQESYDVEAVPDGAAALDAIRRDPPDLVITDVMMPRLDGFGLLKAIRSFPETQALPVIVLSARAGNEASIDGYNAGADDYLIKPFTARELLARVRSHLNLSRLRNEVKVQAQLLEATRARSEQLLQLMPTAACVCDQDGRVTFFNDHAAKLLGKRPTQGADWSEFAADFKIQIADGLPAPARQTPMAIAAREGRLYRDLEIRIVRPDGQELFLSANIDPLWNADGRPAGAINVFVDMTARKLREQDAFFLSALSQQIALLRDEKEVIRTATRLIGQYLGVQRCYFVEPDESGRILGVRMDWRQPGVASLEGKYEASLFGSEEWLHAYRSATLAVEDAYSHPLSRGFRQNYEALGVRSYATSPFIREGRWVVVLAVTDDKPRAWTPRELELMENTVARVWPLAERARVAGELRSSEERFRMFADHIAALAWTADRLGWATWYNRRWFEYTGTTLEEMRDRGWEKIQHPDHLARVSEGLRNCLESGLPWEDTFPLRGKDGTYRWFLSRAEPIRDEDDRIVRWFGTNIDITELRTAQEALQRHSRTLEILNQAGISLAAELNLEKIVQRVTDAGREVSGAAFGAFFYNVKNEAGESYTLYTLSGAPREAFSKFPMPRNTEIFDPTFKGAAPVRLANVLKDPRFGKNAPYHGMPKGHLPVCSYLAVPVKARSGDVLGGLFYGHPDEDVFTVEAETAVTALAAQAAIAIDNSVLHSALQKELDRANQGQEATRRLALVVQSSDDAIITKDLNGTIMSWNAGAQRIFGYTAEEAIGKSIMILIPVDRRNEEVEILTKIRNGQRIDHYETVRRAKTGRFVDVSLSVSPIQGEDGTVIGASKIARDISERRKMECGSKRCTS